MDHKPKCKMQTIKLLESNIEENLNDFGYVDAFLDTTQKTQYMKEIIDKLGFFKIKNFSVKDNIKRIRNKPQTRRRYLQKTHLIKDCYPIYTKDS